MKKLLTLQRRMDIATWVAKKLGVYQGDVAVIGVQHILPHAELEKSYMSSRDIEKDVKERLCYELGKQIASAAYMRKREICMGVEYRIEFKYLYD